MSIVEKEQPPIPEEFSVYLDLLRVGAAYFVLLFHMMNHQMGPEWLLRLIPDHGHDAVILFFVLSGYVIAAATERKKMRGAREYFLDRASRVYSVALPALMLSALLGMFFQPLLKPLAPYSSGELAATTVINLFFLGQSWSLKALVFFNQPYWSLCYEVMYYIGFGVFTFATGRARWLGLLFVALISGPKVLLLLPCWLLGVLAYTQRNRLPLKARLAFVVAFVMPAVVLYTLHRLGFGSFVRSYTNSLWSDWGVELERSNDFPIDYITAILVAINLYGARYVNIIFLRRWKAGVAEAASFSFTLYLIHFPLIFLAINVFGAHADIKSFLIGAVGIPLVCYLLSKITEQKRLTLRNLMNRGLSRKLLR